MKRKILFALCLFGGLSGMAQTPNNVILLLNIGQSNVVGRAFADPANEVPPTPGAYWYKQSTNSVETLIDGIGENISHATDRSMNPMLGKRLKELTGHDVIIVPAGVGNTFISYWQKNNTLYDRAKQMWQDALAYCAANNITVHAKYAHWLQGENDAGVTETDGYYVMLNQLTNDLVSDVGVQKVFATRIGYDPNYTSAANSEKIMKAQKILSFNNPNFIMDSYAPPTFTVGNGKMSYDQTHHALLGLNQEAEDIAQAIHYYRTTGGKISLTENVASLQGVTSGYINLTPVWSFDFSNNIDEANQNVTMRLTARDFVANPTLSYTADGGLIINQHVGVRTSRPFSSATFTYEIRVRMTSASGWRTISGDGAGGMNNKLMMDYNTGNSHLYVQFGTSANVFGWDLGNTVDMSAYHTFKFTQANGVLKFYLDGALKATETSIGTLNVSHLGMPAEASQFDMDGVIDFFRVRNTVDNILPLKFKSFKATNIK